jgi:hypothetical protein
MDKILCEMCKTEKPKQAFSFLPGICDECWNEYQASIRFHLVDVSNNPDAAQKQFCDTCNDWMPNPHKHKPRKKWLEGER